MKQTSLVASFLALLIAAATAGCVAPATDDLDPGNPDDPSNPSNPGDPIEPPVQLSAEGTYQLTSTFDLRVDTVLPEQAYSKLKVLEDFREQPANTLFELLDQAGVPLVADLLDALPDALANQLTGWIDDFVLGNQTVTGAIDEVLGVARIVLTQFEITSELDLAAPGSDGTIAATHRLVTFHLPTGAGTLDVDVSPVPDLTSTTADAWLESENGSRQLVVGEHTFGVPYGEYAFAAFESVLQDRYGADLRGTLGLLVDCPAMAASVADRCINLGVTEICVGHEAELQAICDSGLDELADRLQEEIESMRFDALAFASGEATLRDAGTGAAANDGLADDLDGGVWQAAIDLTQGPRELPATFSGSHVR